MYKRQGVYHTPLGVYHTPLGVHHTPLGVYHTPLGVYHTPLGVYHTPLGVYHTHPWGGCPSSICSTTKREPIPNDTHVFRKFSARRFQRRPFLAPALFQPWRYQPIGCQYVPNDTFSESSRIPNDTFSESSRIPNDTFSESSRRYVSNADFFLAPALFQLLRWRYRSWKIGPGGGGIHGRIRVNTPLGTRPCTRTIAASATPSFRTFRDKG